MLEDIWIYLWEQHRDGLSLWDRSDSEDMILAFKREKKT